MRKKLVYICSPCRGDIEKNIEKAQRYCREAVELWDDVIPIAPHVYFTQFLDDTKQEERAAGMDMGLSLLAMCDELWVYGIENPSEGMRSEIEYAKQHQIPIRPVDPLRGDAQHVAHRDQRPDPLVRPPRDLGRGPVLPAEAVDQHGKAARLAVEAHVAHAQHRILQQGRDHRHVVRLERHKPQRRAGVVGILEARVLAHSLTRSICTPQAPSFSSTRS